METARQLQCKALCKLEKSRRRKNNEEQWKKQCGEQWKQSEIRALMSGYERSTSSEVVTCDRWRPNEKMPADEGGRQLAHIRD
jgi:hypothetical protein